MQRDFICYLSKDTVHVLDAFYILFTYIFVNDISGTHWHPSHGLTLHFLKILGSIIGRENRSIFNRHSSTYSVTLLTDV